MIIINVIGIIFNKLLTLLVALTLYQTYPMTIIKLTLLSEKFNIKNNVRAYGLPIETNS